MEFTTTTKIARNGKKEFDKGIKIVMCNNEDIGMIWGKDYYEFFKNSGLIEQIREEMREANDPETVKLISDFRNWKNQEDSISFDDFVKKYDI